MSDGNLHPNVTSGSWADIISMNKMDANTAANVLAEQIATSGVWSTVS